MKSLLVPTDFSAAAANASRYALHLAKQLKLNIKLCNAIFVPAESAMAAQIAWPMENYEEIKKDTDDELHVFANKLMHEDRAVSNPASFHPKVTFESEVGRVGEIVDMMVGHHQIPFVVMGTSGAGALNRFLLGSSTRNIIDTAQFPVLLVPPTHIYKGITRIAFATDLANCDIEIIRALTCIARPYDAEIQLIHITSEKIDKYDDAAAAKTFCREVSEKVDYKKIDYHHVKSADVDHGLNWVLDHGRVDILAMRHDHNNFLQAILHGSHTQKLSRHTDIPLMVFAGCKDAKLFSAL